MLAQEHTKHGRLRGIFPGNAGQLYAGRICSGVEQQALIPPQQKDHLIPGRLLHFIDPKAQQLRPQLLQNRL